MLRPLPGSAVRLGPDGATAQPASPASAKTTTGARQRAIRFEGVVIAQVLSQRTHHRSAQHSLLGTRGYRLPTTWALGNLGIPTGGISAPIPKPCCRGFHGGLFTALDIGHHRRRGHHGRGCDDHGGRVARIAPAWVGIGIPGAVRIAPRSGPHRAHHDPDIGSWRRRAVVARGWWVGRIHRPRGDDARGWWVGRSRRA